MCNVVKDLQKSPFTVLVSLGLLSVDKHALIVLAWVFTSSWIILKGRGGIVNSSVTSNTINQEIAFFGLFKEQNPFQCPLQTA